MSRGEDLKTKQNKLNKMKIQMSNDLNRYVEVHTKLKTGEIKIADNLAYAKQTFNALRNRFLAISNFYNFDEKGKYLLNATAVLKDNTNLKNTEICKILEREIAELRLETRERVNKIEFLKKYNFVFENEMEQ